jgi:hypothetical protein
LSWCCPNSWFWIKGFGAGADELGNLIRSRGLELAPRELEVRLLKSELTTELEEIRWFKEFEKERLPEAASLKEDF